MGPDQSNFKTKIKSMLIILENFLMAVKLSFICKKLKIDIIHSNSTVINIGGIVSKLTKIKHIWHIREFAEEDHNLKFVLNRKKSLDFMNKYSIKIIAISKAIINKYKYDFSDEKVKLIYNGVEIVKDCKKYTDNININILLAGAIKKNKGQMQAVLAINDLIKDGYKNIILNLAGNEEDGYGDVLRKFIKENGIQDNVIFLGFRDDLSKIRSKMDIELICSKKEAFGRVTVEAMMCGNPIIGANTGATKELIKNEFNGLLYQEGNIEDLKNKIKILIKNPKDREIMGYNGRKMAVEKFTAEKNCNEIIKLYNSVKKSN